MLRNDYRRALIMLRSLRQGVSGYVRLERRTLIGTMQFTVSGAGQGEALYALLLYEQNGLWHACLLDRLGEPRYGQCGMVHRFDPRNICGRPLENYALIAVASQREETCELLLAGYLNGTVLTDWQQVRQAVCQALAPAEAATAAPLDDVNVSAQAEAESPPPPIPAISVREIAEEEEPEPTMPDESAPSEDTEEARSEDVPETPRAEPEPDAFDRPASAPLKAASEPAPADEFDMPALSLPKEPETAGDLLGLDMTQPWPDGIEPLRALFQSGSAIKPFEAEGFALIEIPLAAPGAQRGVVGISAENGRPVRVLYGVPGRHAPEPPAGLEGYEWRGGPEEGYWVTVRTI